MRKPQDIRLVFDFDGVICWNNSGDYKNARPYIYSIKQINKAYHQGYYIIICTARYSQRGPGRQYQLGYEEAIQWLRKYGVLFHELHMGKPSGDIYVDDKAHQIRGDNTNDWKAFWKRVETLPFHNQYNELYLGLGEISKP